MFISGHFLLMQPNNAVSQFQTSILSKVIFSILYVKYILISSCY